LLLLFLLGATWLLAVWIGHQRKGDTAMKSTWKIVVVVLLVAAIVTVFALKPSESDKTDEAVVSDPSHTLLAASQDAPPATGVEEGLPRLVDLGADKCIPCKMMAPILEELKEQYAGRLEVVFLDVWKDPDAGPKYGVKLIPTQIFYDASGEELFRHEGFFAKEDILAKWKEFGVDLSASAAQAPAFERLAPAESDVRPKDAICYMCDGDIEAANVVTVQTDKGPVRLCGPHCYFIMYSCLTEDKTDFEKKVAVTSRGTGKPVPIAQAVFLYGQDETTGRPWVRSFADREAAVAERAAHGGNLLGLEPLRQKEMSHRCGFCDRACYPQDAAEVIVEGGMHTWGCCSHCALGVAARTGKNIEVHEKDRLTKQEIIVKTFDGKVASLEPATAVAWFGQRLKPDGTWASAGCFHQGFFTTAANLKKWVEQNPYETGRLITIRQALANKMKLSPEQIKKACKIGECSPK